MSNPAEQIFHGIATSEGIVIGTAYVFHTLVSDDGDAYPSYIITEDQVTHEIERFDDALTLTRQQIRDSQAERRAGIQREAKTEDRSWERVDKGMSTKDMTRRLADLWTPPAPDAE